MRYQVSAILAIAATSACATTPNAPDRSRVATSLERAGIDAKGLSPTAREWTVPPATSLDDGLAIDEAVAIALWNNQGFQVALASLGLARADLIEAGLLRNPVFSLLFPWGPKQLEFTLTWPIDALWQRPKRIEDARLNAEATAEMLGVHGLRLVSEVRLAFLEVLVTDRRLRFAAEQSEVAGQAAKLAEGRLRAGDISEFETRLAQADASRLKAGRLMTLSSRDLAVVRLRALLGFRADTPLPRLIEPALQNADRCVQDAAALLKDAFAARPEVRAAELQIEAAGARAGLERARILSFTASLDANAKGSEGFEMGPGLAMELPILSTNQGRRARAAAEIEQTSRRYLSVQATVAAEIAAAVVGLTEAQNVARVLGDDVATSLTRARQQAERLFTAGEISLLDLLVTRQRLIDLEAMRVDATFGINRAIVRLEQAVGRTCGVKRP